ncbi:MAG: DUF4202 domain-containing protein [Acidimicrobiales bacterium]|jgi:hypothetical protein|nr:DUF4202 domain-containing protein [Acidimicrobiales bacterium]
MPDHAAARLAAAFAAIDAVNADDPNTLEYGGVAQPKELLHAELVTRWVQRLDPDAGEAQLLAARAHHLRRWSVPRSSYPAGRAGYLRWRTALRRQHADETAALLVDCGYDGATIARVGQIVRKEGLGSDPQVQTHEDALCLTFLETQLDPVAGQLGEDKTVEVLRKTLRKMSPAARGLALELPLSVLGREVVDAAVQGLGEAET